MKLGKLPNRTPTKVTSTFPPEVYETLVDYGDYYAVTYGDNEKLEELVPYIVNAFLESDASFKKARKQAVTTEEQIDQSTTSDVPTAPVPNEEKKKWL